MLRTLIHLACLGLLLANDHVLAAAETTIEASTVEVASVENDNHGISNNEPHYIDIDVQSRRKDWDVFGVLLMSTLRTVDRRGCFPRMDPLETSFQW